MTIGLNTTLKGLGELIFTSHKVPKNQREYAWEDKHIHDFIRDITGAKRDAKSQYFMGTVVITNTTDLPEVVDGQQRMATACIIIAAARDYLISTGDPDNIKSADLLSQKYILQQDPSDLETYPYLTLNDVDNQFFRDHIIEPEGTKKQSSFQKTIPSHVRIKRAYEIAYGEIKKIAEAPPAKARQQLSEIIKYIEREVQVIVLTAPDEASAFVLFETLNDRGIDLAISDLLKNFLLGKAQGRLAEVKTKWHEMKLVLESADAGDDIVMFIRHHWCSKFGLVREKDLYNEIKQHITNSNRTVSYAEELGHNAKLYSQIVNPDLDFWKSYGFDTYKSVKALKYLNHSQPRPLLLAILNKFDEKEIRKATKLVESWAFRFSFTKSLGGEGMEREYSTLAKEITEGAIKSAEELRQSMKKAPSDDDFKDALGNFPLRKALLARYILIELEKEKTGKIEHVPNENPEMVNLEHILPKSFSPVKWPAFSEEQHFRFSPVLGNLTIMSNRENRTAGQETFEEKKKIYEQSEIAITKELATYNAWTPTELTERQKELAELAIKRWAI